MANEHVEVVILGAGIAGLGAALRARETGRQAVIFEAGSSAGGLLDNFVVDGFRFDKAVHLSFATESKVREIFDKTPYHTHPSDSYCFDAGTWMKHPVQNNLFPLAADEKVDLIESFLTRPDDNVDAGNYEDWLLHQYGLKIATRFPIRYTRKYWDTPASKLSTTWIGNRMRRAELREILYGSYTSDTPNTYYTKEMRYPTNGGYKAFIQPLINDSTVRVGHEAIKVDTKNKLVHFRNGSVVSYGRLVSTLPLPTLIDQIDDAPADVKAAAKTLAATSIDLISVGFNSDVVKDLWFYIYDEDILASRAYSPSVKSKSNVPQGCSSLQFEVYSRGQKSKYQVDELLQNTKMAIQKMAIADESDILFMHHKFLPFGNVIFDSGMEAQRSVVLDFLQDVGVASCGRFGKWDYLWSNQSLISGYEALN